MVALLRCPRCARYTLKPACSQCGAATVRAGPPRYSPEDPYGQYRRKLKRLAREEAGQALL